MINELNNKEKDILELKQFLTSTDYKIIKGIDPGCGEVPSEDLINSRQNARISIRRLESEIEELKIYISENEKDSNVIEHLEE